MVVSKCYFMKLLLILFDVIWVRLCPKWEYIYIYIYPKNVSELFIYKVFVWYFEFKLSTFIKNNNWSSFIIFIIKSFLCNSQFTRLPLNGFYSGLLYFFNQRNPILMPKLRWRRYWWEKVADVIVRKWMNEGCEEKLCFNYEAENNTTTLSLSPPFIRASHLDQSRISCLLTFLSLPFSLRFLFTFSFNMNN